MASMPHEAPSKPAAPLDLALARLDGAIIALRRAVAVREAADGDTAHTQDDLARLERDRADLAERLDAAEGRADRLREANAEVAKRLVRVMELVRRMDRGL